MCEYRCACAAASVPRLEDILWELILSLSYEFWGSPQAFRFAEQVFLLLGYLTGLVMF